jgi:Xaa-Pro aminopeptidase
LLFLPDGRHFISDGRYQEQARREVVDFQLHIDTGDSDRKGRGLSGSIHEQGLLEGPYRLAFEADHVPVSRFNDWRGLFPRIEWVETTQLVAGLAVIKDKEELAALTEAVRITDRVFEEIKNDLKPGTIEREVAARLAYLIRHYGSEGDSFDPVVASGRRGALPHARPSGKFLDPGDFVVLDFGARYGGYHADMTRTVCITEATDRHHEVYSTVLEAQRRGVAAARAHVPASQVDAACRDYITEKGYGKYFLHSTGHGVGLEVHTLPRLSRESSDVLEADMVVTIEPGIYLPDWGGVRIEDDVLIGKDEGVPLNQATRELLILG